MLPGPTPEQSVNNLYRWLDTLATTLGLRHSLAAASNAHRIPGVFDHLSRSEEQMFRRQLDHVCNNASAGFVVEVSGGGGTGKETLSVVAVGLGPFLC